MKCIPLILVALAATINVYAQKKSSESFYLFDGDMKGTQRQEDARYFGRLMQVSDTSWMWDLYNYMGPRIKRIEYKDARMQTPHGKLLYYNKNGYYDSTGYAYDNLRHGDWYYYNDTGKAITKKQYELGHLVSTVQLDTLTTQPDTTEGEESTFRGGHEKWRQYLVKNMQFPDRAAKAEITGTVNVVFIVNTDGTPIEPEIEKSLEFSVDEESMRLIKTSPKWTPGRQGGKAVKTFKKQPFVFRFR